MLRNPVLSVVSTMTTLRGRDPWTNPSRGDALFQPGQEGGNTDLYNTILNQ